MFKKLKLFSLPYLVLIGIIVSSFVLRVYYAFYLNNFVTLNEAGDMGAYWYKALERYHGNIFNVGQWSGLGVFYHIYLTFIVKIFYYFNQFDKAKGSVILLNIIYATMSIPFVYLISMHILKSKVPALLATFFYAFSYPLIYLNIFLLGENVAIPVLVISTYFVFKFYDKKLVLFLVGLFFGLAIAIRPSLGLVGLIFFFYVFFSRRPYLMSFLNAVCFLIGFILVLFLASQEIHYISKGQTKLLYPLNGANFFFSNCEYTSIFSSFKGYEGTGYIYRYQLDIPSTNPVYKQFITNHSLHDNKYFYKLGLNCIKKNPSFWKSNLKREIRLFFDFLYPFDGRVKELALLIKPFSYLIFFMTITLGMIFFLNKVPSIDFKRVLTLFFIILSVPVTTFFYWPNQIYFYPVIFAVYILFFIILLNIRKYKLQAFVYCQVLLVIWLFYKIFS